MANILQHNIERFGMVTVMDVVLYGLDDDVKFLKPILFLDTLKMTNISTEGSAKEIRGGIGNDMLINYDFGRTATIEMQDALLSTESLAILWGTTVGDTKVVDYNEVRAARPTGVTAVPGSVYIYPVDGTTAAIAEGESDFEDYTDGTSPEARFIYQVEVTNKEEIVLTNDNFPSVLRMVGETFVIDERTGVKKKIQIEVPKLKINSNFSFSLDAEGDASVFDFSGVALANESGEIIKVKHLGNY
jgi:hypothetical protein